MKNGKRLVALILILSLTLCACAAQASGLDGLLSYYTDINEDTRFSASVQLDALMPFGEDALKLLNGVLGHITLSAGITTREDGDETTLQMLADGESAFTITQRREGESYELDTTLLPNRTLSGDADILDALFGSEDGEAAFDALAAIDEVQGVYKALTDGILPYAEEKKANYKIKSIGTAKWSRVARLTPEQSAELIPQIAAVLGCGMDAEYRALLESITCSKGFVVALYRTAADGKDIAVYMKGDITFADGSLRSLSYQWAFTDGGTERSDTYKFEVKKKKSPADNRIIAASYKQRTMSDRLSVSGKSETTLKVPEKTTLTTVKHDLVGSVEGDKRTLTGTVSSAVKTTVDGKSVTETTTITPSLSLTSAEGSGVLSGSADFVRLRGKNLILGFRLTLDDKPAQRLSADAQSGELFAVGDTDVSISVIDPLSGVAAEPQTEPEAEADPDAGEAAAYSVGEPPIGCEEYSAPEEHQTIDISGATRERLAPYADEMAQRLAGELLLRLSRLAGEDAALLSDGMTQEDFDAFMSVVKGL